MQITFTPDEAKLVLDQMNGHGSALKNWIVTAVETNRTDDAVKLVKELRMTEEIVKMLRKASKQN